MKSLKELILPISIMVIGTVGGIVITMAARKNTLKEPKETVYFDYPEEWRAITSDTMQVVRIGDTIHLYFIQPPMTQ